MNMRNGERPRGEVGKTNPKGSDNRTPRRDYIPNPATQQRTPDGRLKPTQQWGPDHNHQI